MCNRNNRMHNPCSNIYGSEGWRRWVSAIRDLIPISLRAPDCGSIRTLALSIVWFTFFLCHFFFYFTALHYFVMRMFALEVNHVIRVFVFGKPLSMSVPYFTTKPISLLLLLRPQTL